MSRTDNDSIPQDADAEYRTVCWNSGRPMPEYFSVVVNVEEMARRQTIRRINKLLRGAAPHHTREET